MRRLSKISLLLCLALGGAHNALAAALCAHFECQPAARAVAPRAAGDASHEAHDNAAPPARHCGAETSRPRHEDAATAAHHSADASTFDSDSDSGHAAAHPAPADGVRAGTAGDAAAMRSLVAAPSDCAHCAGRPAPASLSERRAEGPRRAPHLAPQGASLVASHPRLPASSAARLAPTQHAPPRRTIPQYLLISVFLI
jgi:hypothetical protein